MTHRARAGLMLAAALLACLWASTPPRTQASVPSRPNVPVTGGWVAGRMDGTDAVFQGIPYAAAPVGPNRWRPPQAVRPWAGVRDAGAMAPACPQRDLGWNADSAAHWSEDCLTLDIRTPALGALALSPARPSPPLLLPVMVWIHGGANWAGSARGVVHSTLTRQGVVLVAIQYRLDVLGFLSHPAFTRESPHKASGNYGLMDQIAALRWVRDNIARFGGDPRRVTVFGESAGAQDVGLLMTSPLARGLFSRAIEQSGTAGFGQPPRSLDENEAIGVALAQDLARDLALPQGDGPDTAAALRAIPVARLLDAGARLVPPAIEDASFLWLQAVSDGWVLPRPPAAVLAAGGQAAVPLLIGANARELPLHGGEGIDTVRRWLLRAYAAHPAAALDAYGLTGLDMPPSGLPPPDPRLGSVADQVADDITFRCPMLTVARQQAALGVPVWVYHFDASPGATHGSDLPYVFDGLSVAGTGTPDKGAEGAVTLQRYWANFARTGDPNGPGLPVWPAFTPDDRRHMAFTPDGPRGAQDLRRRQCDLIGTI